jgi:UDPglucose 6-dehydrogenase
MGVESGEMTKHAINGFLAMSVAYINEIASICEQTGADAIEVGRGLRSERRIGPGAYLSPGDAFGGGTLARDLQFLDDLATSHGVSAELVRGTIDSNAEHRNWSRRTLARLLGAEAHESAAGLSGRQIAIWGLTYKPGTDTLRRSTAIELCRWLHAGGVDVRGYDPAISALPVADSGTLRLCESPLAALAGADALVVCTPWPQFAEIAPNAVVAAMAEPVVIDASGFLAATLEGRTDVRYARVGARRT